MNAATLYQFLRDRRNWQARLVALEPDADGNLMLARLPGPTDGVAIAEPAPYAPGASGIVTGPCGAVFVADTAGGRVLFLDGLCNAQAELHGFYTPQGLAIGDDALWVADCDAGRVRRLAFPTLEPVLDISAGLAQPSGVACDRSGRILVLDTALRCVRRHAANGIADSAYDATITGSGKLIEPLFLATGAEDRLFVSDGATQAVRCFDAAGHYLSDFATPPTGWRPGAIAAGAGRVFVADSAGGGIQVFLEDGTWWCALPKFRAPATALWCDPETGDLLIKTAFDETFLRLAAGQCFAAEGRLESGPFDAGEKCEWFRAACTADLPSGTSLVFEMAQEATAGAPPAGDWVQAPAPDTLLAALLPAGPPPELRRFLWLRATLATVDSTVTPVLHGVRAETAGEDYRAYLPAMFARDDEPNRFLFRLLALTRTELGAVEENIEAMPLLLAPDFVPATELGWLAAWLGLELPMNAGDTEKRALIARAARLWRRRGTPRGVAEMVEIYTGVRPSIIESFAERGLWVLDQSSRLGFDTGLPASDPVGMIVPDATDPLIAAAGCCATTVGSAVVGESGPLPVADLGEPLFTNSAHRFLVLLPSYRAEDAALVSEVRRVIEAEKPAHAGYNLCLVRPDMRVGFQATVGVDTIVGGPPDSLRLGRSLLGQSASLPPPIGGAARVGQGTRVDGDAITLR